MPSEGGGRRFSEDTAREIDLAVRERIDRTYQKALDILRGRRAELDRLAKVLLEKETLTAESCPRRPRRPRRRPPSRETQNMREVRRPHLRSEQARGRQGQ